jgi:hypothetical protein
MREEIVLGSMLRGHGFALLRKPYRREIERAIANAKRTAWDKWFRRQWYRAAAQRRKRYAKQHSSHRLKLSGARRW